MRENKFRAWDKKLKKYHYFEGIFNEQPWTETSTFAQYESCPKLHEVEIEEWTGLFDKNGKDIYEGDVVRMSNVVGEVSFEKGCFDVLEKWIGCFKDDIEIIGNIHENLELMK